MKRFSFAWALDRPPGCAVYVWLWAVSASGQLFPTGFVRSVPHHITPIFFLLPRPRHLYNTASCLHHAVSPVFPSPPPGIPTPSTARPPWTAQPLPGPARRASSHPQRQQQPRPPQWGSRSIGRGRRPPGLHLGRPQGRCPPRPWPPVRGQGQGQGQGLWVQGRVWRAVRWRRSGRHSGGWWRGSRSSGSSWRRCVRVSGRTCGRVGLRT